MRAWIVGLMILLMALFAAVFYLVNKWINPSAV